MMTTSSTTGCTTIGEGNIGIKKQWGNAVAQVKPGFYWTIMPGLNYHELEVRERKISKSLNAYTIDQMLVSTNVSASVTPDQSSMLELYKEYGGIEQFDSSAIVPKLAADSKACFTSFGSVTMITNRDKIEGCILEKLTKSTEDHHIVINDIHIDDIRLPESYEAAITETLIASERYKQSQFELDKQNIEVQTAQAASEAGQIRADSHAYKLLTEATAEAIIIESIGLAEASAIGVMSKALSSSPNVSNYIRAKNCDGNLPEVTTNGDDK